VRKARVSAWAPTNGPGNVGSINIGGGNVFTTIIGINGTPTEVSGAGTAIIVNSINVPDTAYHGRM